MWCQPIIDYLRFKSSGVDDFTQNPKLECFQPSNQLFKPKPNPNLPTKRVTNPTNYFFIPKGLFYGKLVFNSSSSF
jgi:hypothetical protein